MEHFNKLSPAEDERLAFLLEEMGEALQIIGKIQRHGYESRDPTRSNAPTNRTMLEKEIGDVLTAINVLTYADLDPASVARRRPRKLEKLLGYTHHNRETIGELIDLDAERKP